MICFLIFFPLNISFAIDAGSYTSEEYAQAIQKESKRDRKLKAFGALLKSKKSRDRLMAIEELGKMGADAHSVVHALCKQLNSEDPVIKKATIETLGKIGPIQ